MKVRYRIFQLSQRRVIANQVSRSVSHRESPVRPRQVENPNRRRRECGEKPRDVMLRHSEADAREPEDQAVDLLDPGGNHVQDGDAVGFVLRRVADSHLTQVRWPS